jgi:hypothetical protein
MLPSRTPKESSFSAKFQNNIKPPIANNLSGSSKSISDDFSPQKQVETSDEQIAHFGALERSGKRMKTFNTQNFQSLDIDALAFEKGEDAEISNQARNRRKSKLMPASPDPQLG